MALTIRKVIKKDKIGKDGKAPIAICVTIDRQRTYFNTGLRVPLSAWNDGVKSTHPNADMYNVKITAMITDLERKLLEKDIKRENTTIAVIRSLMVKDQGRGDFLEYCSTVLEEKKNPGTLRRYKFELEALKTYSPRLSFADITPVFLTKYYKHLTKTIAHNSAINAFKFIRMVFNHAKDHGVTTIYPFSEWKYPKYIPTEKTYLTMEETEKIWALLDKPNIDKSLIPVIVFFSLECFAGLRVSDWGKFNLETRLQNENLVLRTTKTNVRVQLPVDLMPSLKRVLDYIKAHNLTYTESGEHANRMLKSIATLAGINKRLTTHVARHTFATMWLEKGMSKEGIAELLGVSVRIVNTYAKYTDNKLRSEISRIGGI